MDSTVISSCQIAKVVPRCGQKIGQDGEHGSPPNYIIYLTNFTSIFFRISRFQAWGESQPHRPAEDVAYAVAYFFASGGTYQNYYMVKKIILVHKLLQT